MAQCAGHHGGVWRVVLATLQNMLDLATTIFTGAVRTLYNTLTDLGVDMETVMSGVVTWWQEKWSAMVGFVQPVLNIIDSLKPRLGAFFQRLARESQHSEPIFRRVEFAFPCLHGCRALLRAP